MTATKTKTQTNSKQLSKRQAKNKHITTGRKIAFRITDHERTRLTNLVELLQKKIPDRNITASRVLRATARMEGAAALRVLVKALRERW